MNELAVFYDAIDRETLDLINYHKQCLEDAEKSGNHDPEYEEKIIVLDQLIEHVHERVIQKKILYEKEKQIESDLLQSRGHGDCPTCNDSMDVEIIGEEKNEELDVICDTVICKHCGTEFMNPMPNTWSDRLKLFEFIITSFGGLIDAENKRSNNTTDLQAFIELVEGCKKMKEAQLEVERTERDLWAAIKASEVAQIDLRDFLLMAKLKGMRWDNLDTFVN